MNNGFDDRVAVFDGSAAQLAQATFDQGKCCDQLF